MRKADFGPLVPGGAATVDETRTILHCSKQMVYDIIERGELKSFTIGRSRRVTLASIDALVGNVTAVKPVTELEMQYMRDVLCGVVDEFSRKFEAAGHPAPQAAANILTALLTMSARVAWAAGIKPDNFFSACATAMASEDPGR